MGSVPEDNLSRFVRQTNASQIDTKVLERFTEVTGREPHRYLRRGIVFCHRDLDVILDKFERGEPFYFFTGRGPSSDSLHIGHSIPFEFTKWLQDVFDAPLIIMLTDDMKLLHDKKLAFEDVRRFDVDNAKDILAFGFKPEKTFLFSNLDYVGGAFYQNIISVARHISVRDIKTSLGFNDDHNVGMFYCCSTQSAGTFATSYPNILGTDNEQLRSMSCLIACSYDIDGYFTEVRKHAKEIGYQSPAFLYSSLLPALQGTHAKMSASVQSSAIFLTDTPSMIREKLEDAFPTAKQDTETIFQYLRFFMEHDRECQKLVGGFQAREISSEKLRDTLIEVVQAQIARFQQDRSQITDEYLATFMKPRLIA